MSTDAIKPIDIEAIRTDGDTQVRVQLDEDTVNRYVEARKRREVLPPIIVVHDGSDYWLADGFHRYHAAVKDNCKQIRAEVRRGTCADTLDIAIEENSKNGLPFSNADKRRIVGLMLNRHPEDSSRSIAGRCKVGHQLVETVRKERQVDESSTSTRAGKDGKQYPASKGASFDLDPSHDHDVDQQTRPNTTVPTHDEQGEPAPEQPSPAKNGREVFPSKDRTEARRLIGKLIRLLSKTGVWNQAKPHADKLAEVIERAG